MNTDWIGEWEYAWLLSSIFNAIILKLYCKVMTRSVDDDKSLERGTGGGTSEVTCGQKGNYVFQLSS
jgi:hypothetical protein